MQSQSNFSTWFHLGLQFNSNRLVRVQILSQISQISHKLIFLFQTPIKSHRRTNGEKHIIAITERNTLNRLWQLCRGLHLQMCRIQVVQILLFWITGSKISQTRRISILSDSHKSVAFSRGYFVGNNIVMWAQIFRTSTSFSSGRVLRFVPSTRSRQLYLDAKSPADKNENSTRRAREGD